ncbi:sensor histidine kinase [Roseateles violae]|uniref:histidine kinase n=1 Tax=Roseateles violae TaxID=3058042 RepID=A0ABT8DTV0_9BURK|nr:ATP-binding protein [Pelomonas sp. PFR6]MDN3919802.1 ATP-binding protein [Pelomonas sp. PFR6]
MNSLGDAAARTRRLPRRGAALLLGLALSGLLLGLLSLLLELGDGGSLGLPALATVALCTALLLLVVAALGWHVGVRLTRQRLGEALREARLQTQALTQLQPDWLWATDAEHHLVRWQAPQGAVASSWVGAAATQALWERFELDEPADEGHGDLRARLQAQANFAGLRVRKGDGSGGRWLLRGLASWDGQGRFAGYQGTARALVVEANVNPGGWIETLPMPACLLGGAEGATVLALNGAAAALGGGLALGADWRACLTQLPAAQQRWALGEPLDGRRLACLQTAAAADAALELSERESFSYTVSHDLRAPLRVVEGFARILKEDYGRLLDRIGNDHLDRVMGAAARMNSMIDALLSLAQLSTQPLQQQPVNLSQLAGFVIEELRRHAPERAVEVQIQPQLLVQGDPTLLRMLLENLLGNAWKYSGKCERSQIRFELLQLQDGQRAFVIADNGAGFDMRFADRLFGVFQRLHSASDFQGTGVGLASVRRIVRRHGGEIWAESEPGQGARFYFTLAG